ncbi:MAG: hypothetical protein FVQ81_13755, partial [Candidatus Glassbacteria bacterium]|nr:hypothetical protein [Candidatus Glassbacteria bacterium]
MKELENINRRRFIAGAAGTAALLAAVGKPQAAQLRSPLDRPVRLGFVGTGNRGTGLIRTMLGVGGVEIPAICDIDSDHLNRAAGEIEQAGGQRPELYARGPEDFRRLVERDDLDAVMTATPWELHTPVCVAAMEAGKYAATEVPAAVTVDDCWRLVETSERTG